MGVKLKKLVVDRDDFGSPVLKETEYAGGIIYENGTLEMIPQPEGYIQPGVNGGYDYVYQYEDHLGNIRVSYSDLDGNNYVDSSEILSEKHYYPFGMTQKGYGAANSSMASSAALKYGFGGKELQDELNLDWYDITARNYDPALGRWMNIDPLAEQMRRHSPYNYAFDNPIYFMDPDGMAPSGGCPPGDPDCGSTKMKSGEQVLTDKVVEKVDQAVDDLPVEAQISWNLLKYGLQKASDALGGKNGTGLRIWGEGSGGNSTRDDGSSEGSIENTDLPTPGLLGKPGSKSFKMGPHNATKQHDKTTNFVTFFNDGMEDTSEITDQTAGFTDAIVQSAIITNNEIEKFDKQNTSYYLGIYNIGTPYGDGGQVLGYKNAVKLRNQLLNTYIEGTDVKIDSVTINPVSW